MNTKEENTKEEKTCAITDETVTDINANIEENKDVTSDIIAIFNPEYAYPLEDIMGELRTLGYSNPGSVVLCAIQDDILYVDSIEDDGTVYIAIVDNDENKGDENKGEEE